MLPKKPPAEAIRDRVLRALEQVLGAPDVDVYVKFAYVGSDTIRIHITSRVWQCVFSAPVYAAYEDLVVRVQKALMAAKIGSESQKSGDDPDRR